MQTDPEPRLRSLCRLDACWPDDPDPVTSGMKLALRAAIRVGVLYCIDKLTKNSQNCARTRHVSRHNGQRNTANAALRLRSDPACELCGLCRSLERDPPVPRSFMF